MSDQGEHTKEQARARFFLRTLLKAASTQDYEAVEQLRRLLAVAHYRKALRIGIAISEEDAIPNTAVVEKWLSLFSKGGRDLLEEIEALQQPTSDTRR